MQKNTPQYNIDLRSFGQTTDNQIEGLSILLRELFPHHLIDGRSYLSSVWVVPSNEMEQYIQAIAAVAQGEGTYTSGDHSPGGVAIPCEKDGNLVCFILIADDKISQLTSQSCHQMEIVSTLLGFVECIGPPPLK